VTDQLSPMLISIAVLALVLLCVGVLFVGLSLSRLAADVRRVVTPTADSQLARLKAQEAANRFLLESEEGNEMLLRFMVSEIALMEFLDEFETDLRKSPPEGDFEQLITLRVRQPVTVSQQLKNWLKRKAAPIAEKIFDKANDLVKTFIPGADGK